MAEALKVKTIWTNEMRVERTESVLNDKASFINTATVPILHKDTSHCGLVPESRSAIFVFLYSR